MSDTSGPSYFHRDSSIASAAKFACQKTKGPTEPLLGLACKTCIVHLHVVFRDVADIGNLQVSVL